MLKSVSKNFTPFKILIMTLYIFLKIIYMVKHKSRDYKISIVVYYLNNINNDGYNKRCRNVGCKKKCCYLNDNSIFLYGYR